jgi:2-phosphosulfolactate phosphatase
MTAQNQTEIPALEVLLSPAEFESLPDRDLSATVCVVFDVLRATSSMVTALANGADGILPVEDIPEALQVRARQPEVLLAGERQGHRIQAELTGNVSFDLGNSPREFTREKVSGRIIVMTTTNGTRALRACAQAQTVLAACFLNLRATAQLLEKLMPCHLLLVCGGTFDQAAYEDALCAGALCNLVWPRHSAGAVADSAHMVRLLYDCEKADLTAALAQSRNGRRLLAQPELRDDVAFCAQTDIFSVAAELAKDGLVRKRS